MTTREELQRVLEAAEAAVKANPTKATRRQYNKAAIELHLAQAQDAREAEGHTPARPPVQTELEFLASRGQTFSSAEELNQWNCRGWSSK